MTGIEKTIEYINRPFTLLDDYPSRYSHVLLSALFTTVIILFPVRASAGYGFKNGLTLEASATNLFDNDFRSLPGFPRIGRRVTGRVLYNF